MTGPSDEPVSVATEPKTAPQPPAGAWSRWSPRLIGLFTLALVVSTWPMWWASGDYPCVPFLDILRPVPRGVDRALAIGLCAAAAWLTLGGERSGRLTWGGYLIALGGLCLLDQHRFQPWAWLFWLEAAVLAGLGSRRSQPAIRWLVISLYVWSAASKLDVSFLQERGPWLLGGLLQGLGLAPAMIPPAKLQRLAWLLPIGELVTAAALAVPSTRRYGVWLATALHAALLVALGPLGHNHHAGVLLWNLFFLCQNPILFASRPEDHAADQDREHPIVSLLSRGVLFIAIAAPALEPLGLYDHWPAWAVYSDRPEVVRVSILDQDRGHLPAGLTASPPAPLSDWCDVRFDDWSFRTRRGPVYPQARYRLALARWLAGRLPPGTPIRVLVESTPDRWSRQRSRVELLDAVALESFLERFRLGTTSR